MQAFGSFRRLWFYHLVSFLVRNYARTFKRLSLEGQDNIPAATDKGLIIAGNHVSNLDPPLIGSLVPREIHFMAKKELFASQPLRWICEHLMAFPIDRSRSDAKAIKEALRLLKSGVALGIFPQGTRNKGDAEALDGAAFLAQRAGVPLQPVAVWQAQGQQFVRFGTPFYPQGTSREETKELTVRLMSEINALLREATP